MGVLKEEEEDEKEEEEREMKEEEVVDVEEKLAKVVLGVGKVVLVDEMLEAVLWVDVKEVIVVMMRMEGVKRKSEMRLKAVTAVKKTARTEKR